jgi:molecular chaperone DnaK
MSPVVGIDLGTTNSLVAFTGRDGTPSVIRDASGDGLVPSIVSVGADGAVFVGREAQRRLLTDPSRTVYSVKRFMGRGADDVEGEAKLFPFRFQGEAGGVVRLGLADRLFTPPEISAFILRELKRRAEEHFQAQGEFDFEVDRAVITVPAYFNDAQRTATRDAGRLAGLDVLRIVNEPTAASLAYGLDRRNSGTIAVYDFGGGTFDISILRVEDGVFQVLSTNGDTHLGGDDIDQLLVAMVVDDMSAGALAARTHGASGAFALDAAGLQAIRLAVIQAKWDLSDRDSTIIVVRDPGTGEAAYRRPFTREEFERLVRPVIDRTLAPCRLALADAALAASQVDEVVLVGGSTRIPLVRRAVEELFGRKPHADLDPDQVVALGAAVQAHIMVSGSRDMLLLDVTPLSLGIETMGGAVSKIILRNSTIPASGTEMFTTFVDNQTAVDIHVLQGERELVSDNRSLARFKLRGIPPMPAGLPRIQVRFQIDANGILSVGARELRTGIEQKIEVKPSYGLTDGEIERMLLESFEHAESDVEARLLIEARNEAETILRATEKSLRNPDLAAGAREDLAPGEIEAIESALADLRSAMTAGSREAVEQTTKVLNDVTRHLAEVLMNRGVRAALGGRHVDGL